MMRTEFPARTGAQPQPHGLLLPPVSPRMANGQRGQWEVPPSAFRREAIGQASTRPSQRTRPPSQGRGARRFAGKGRASTGRVSPRSKQMPSPFATAPGGPTSSGPSTHANGPSLPQLPEAGPAPWIPTDELGYARRSFRDALKAGRHGDGRANGAVPAAIIPPWEGQPDWAVCASTPQQACNLHNHATWRQLDDDA